MIATDALLRVKDISVTFHSNRGAVKAVDQVSLELRKGEILAVVGESGCGKTTLARAILGLQPLDSGQIQLGDKQVRGPEPGIAKQVGMVWQDPHASLDPRWRVGRSALEPLKLCGGEVDLGSLFEQVGLSREHIERFPHQLSGGQKQRVAIARAIALSPDLVICDEPTAALDLSIQAQILNLLKDLQAQTGCAYLYISHDLATVRFLADRVAVMYQGKIVESGPTEAIFGAPSHPYTLALLASAPSQARLGFLPEAPPEEVDFKDGKLPACRYAPRCPYMQADPCTTVVPELREHREQQVRCHFPR